MNVFVLTTGRTGSTTFAKACSHIRNFSSGHESLCHKLGDERLDYPKYHIEVDNRLCFFLGLLDRKYGDNALYVHLQRDIREIADSFNKRWHGNRSIIYAYAQAINYLNIENLSHSQKMQVCIDYVNATNANIDLFLKDKTNVIKMNLTTIVDDFKVFWDKINAQGSIINAIEELSVKYNSSTI